MSSLTLQRDVAVSIPKLLLAAVQPYQTIAGPALTTNFLTQASLLPFQGLPFTHGSLAPLYFHTLLHALAEYSETPRVVRTSHVKQRHPPHEAFWADVGSLNCFYATRYRPSHPQHPSMGAVELVRASHRKESDVKLTLYDEAYQPLVAMLLTGPRGSQTPPLLSIEGGPRTASNEESKGLSCRMLPAMPPPRERAGYWRSSNEWCGLEAVSTDASEHFRSFGGLYGPLEALQGGGYAQRACYALTLNESASEKEKDHMSSGVEDAVAGPDPLLQLTRLPQASRQEVVESPPWMLMATVQDLCERLHREGRLSPVGGGALNVAETSTWCMGAYQAVQCGDVVFNEPFDIVCAAPRVHPNYRVSPWRHQLGQPVANGCDSCVVALRVEIRQFSTVILSGTFYFQPNLPN